MAQGLDKLCEGKERAEYRREGLEAKLGRAQRDRAKCVDADNCVQSCAGELQEIVKKDFDDLQ